MKKILFIFTFSIAFVSANAQCETGGGTGGGGQSITSSYIGGNSFAVNSQSFHGVGQQILGDSFGSKYAVTQSYSSIKGSAFLSDDAIEGTIVLNDGSLITDVPLKVDLYQQKIIVEKDGEEYYIDNKICKEIILPYEGNSISLMKINPKNPDQFYEVLYSDGDMAFFKERYVTRKQATKNGVNNTPAKFNKRTNYYIKHDNGAIANVKLKKKDFFSGFDGAEVYAMKEYAKEKGIKLKDESDYVAVFNGRSK